MFNLNQVINLNVQSQSSHHIIIHPWWGVTAPAGSVRTGNYESPAAWPLPQAHLNGMLPDWDQWVWSGSVPMGLCDQCHRKAEPYGHLCSGVYLARSVDSGSICKQNLQFALCSFVDQPHHARCPCSVSLQSHMLGLSRYNWLKRLHVSVVEVLLALLHAHYGSHFFFCWVSRLKQCTRHQQLGLFQHLGPGTQTGPMLCLFWRGAWPSGQHSRLSH